MDPAPRRHPRQLLFQHSNSQPMERMQPLERKGSHESSHGSLQRREPPSSLASSPSLMPSSKLGPNSMKHRMHSTVGGIGDNMNRRRHPIAEPRKQAIVQPRNQTIVQPKLLKPDPPGPNCKQLSNPSSRGTAPTRRATVEPSTHPRQLMEKKPEHSQSMRHLHEHGRAGPAGRMTNSTNPHQPMVKKPEHSQYMRHLHEHGRIGPTQRATVVTSTTPTKHMRHLKGRENRQQMMGKHKGQGHNERWQALRSHVRSQNNQNPSHQSQQMIEKHKGQGNNKNWQALKSHVHSRNDQNLSHQSLKAMAGRKPDGEIVDKPMDGVKEKTSEHQVPMDRGRNHQHQMDQSDEQTSRGIKGHHVQGHNKNWQALKSHLRSHNDQNISHQSPKAMTGRKPDREIVGKPDEMTMDQGRNHQHQMHQSDDQALGGNNDKRELKGGASDDDDFQQKLQKQWKLLHLIQDKLNHQHSPLQSIDENEPDRPSSVQSNKSQHIQDGANATNNVHVDSSDDDDDDAEYRELCKQLKMLQEIQKQMQQQQQNPAKANSTLTPISEEEDMETNKSHPAVSSHNGHKPSPHSYQSHTQEPTRQNNWDDDNSIWNIESYCKDANNTSKTHIEDDSLLGEKGDDHYDSHDDSYDSRYDDNSTASSDTSEQVETVLGEKGDDHDDSHDDSYDTNYDDNSTASSDTNEQAETVISDLTSFTESFYSRRVRIDDPREMMLTMESYLGNTGATLMCQEVGGEATSKVSNMRCGTGTKFNEYYGNEEGPFISKSTSRSSSNDSTKAPPLHKDAVLYEAPETNKSCFNPSKGTSGMYKDNVDANNGERIYKISPPCRTSFSEDSGIESYTNRVISTMTRKSSNNQPSGALHNPNTSASKSKTNYSQYDDSVAESITHKVKTIRRSSIIKNPYEATSSPILAHISPSYAIDNNMFEYGDNKASRPVALHDDDTVLDDDKSFGTIKVNNRIDTDDDSNDISLVDSGCFTKSESGSESVSTISGNARFGNDGYVCDDCNTFCAEEILPIRENNKNGGSQLFRSLTSTTANSTLYLDLKKGAKNDNYSFDRVNNNYCHDHVLCGSTDSSINRNNESGQASHSPGVFATPSTSSLEPLTTSGSSKGMSYNDLIATMINQDKEGSEYISPVHSSAYNKSDYDKKFDDDVFGDDGCGLLSIESGIPSNGVHESSLSSKEYSVASECNSQQYGRTIHTKHEEEEHNEGARDNDESSTKSVLSFASTQHESDLDSGPLTCSPSSSGSRCTLAPDNNTILLQQIEHLQCGDCFSGQDEQGHQGKHAQEIKTTATTASGNKGNNGTQNHLEDDNCVDEHKNGSIKRGNHDDIESFNVQGIDESGCTSESQLSMFASSSTASLDHLRTSGLKNRRMSYIDMVSAMASREQRGENCISPINSVDERSYDDDSFAEDDNEFVSHIDSPKEASRQCLVESATRSYGSPVIFNEHALFPHSSRNQALEKIPKSYEEGDYYGAAYVYDAVSFVSNGSSLPKNNRIADVTSCQRRDYSSARLYDSTYTTNHASCRSSSEAELVAQKRNHSSKNELPASHNDSFCCNEKASFASPVIMEELEELTKNDDGINDRSNSRSQKFEMKCTYSEQPVSSYTDNTILLRQIHFLQRGGCFSQQEKSLCQVNGAHKIKSADKAEDEKYRNEDDSGDHSHDTPKNATFGDKKGFDNISNTQTMDESERTSHSLESLATTNTVTPDKKKAMGLRNGRMSYIDMVSIMASRKQRGEECISPINSIDGNDNTDDESFANGVDGIGNNELTLHPMRPEEILKADNESIHLSCGIFDNPSHLTCTATPELEEHVEMKDEEENDDFDDKFQNQHSCNSSYSNSCCTQTANKNESILHSFDALATTNTAPSDKKRVMGLCNRRMSYIDMVSILASRKQRGDECISPINSIAGDEITDDESFAYGVDCLENDECTIQSDDPEGATIANRDYDSPANPNLPKHVQSFGDNNEVNLSATYVEEHIDGATFGHEGASFEKSDGSLSQLNSSDGARGICRASTFYCDYTTGQQYGTSLGIDEAATNYASPRSSSSNDLVATKRNHSQHGVDVFYRASFLSVEEDDDISEGEDSIICADKRNIQDAGSLASENIMDELALFLRRKNDISKQDDDSVGGPSTRSPSSFHSISTRSASSSGSVQQDNYSHSRQSSSSPSSLGSRCTTATFPEGSVSTSNDALVMLRQMQYLQPEDGFSSHSEGGICDNARSCDYSICSSASVEDFSIDLR